MADRYLVLFNHRRGGEPICIDVGEAASVEVAEHLGRNQLTGLHGKRTTDYRAPIARRVRKGVSVGSLGFVARA